MPEQPPVDDVLKGIELAKAKIELRLEERKLKWWYVVAQVFASPALVAAIVGGIITVLFNMHSEKLAANQKVLEDQQAELQRQNATFLGITGSGDSSTIASKLKLFLDTGLLRDPDHRFADTLANLQDEPRQLVFSNLLNASIGEPLDFGGTDLAGLLRPIDLNILDYLIRQRYPRELLYWLFFDSFEYQSPGQPPLGFQYNPPEDLGCDPADDKHRCAVDWVRIATFAGLTVEEKSQVRGSSVGSGPTPYTYARFCFSFVLAKEALATAPQLKAQEEQDTDLTAAEIYAGPLSCGSSAWRPETTAFDPQQDILPITFRNGSVVLKIMPRSVYGVFAFLGRLIRLERSGYKPLPYPPVDPRHFPSARPWVGDMPPKLTTVGASPLISVIDAPADSKGSAVQCTVRTKFRGKEYCITEGEEGTVTKLTFQILADLIRLAKK